MESQDSMSSETSLYSLLGELIILVVWPWGSMDEDGHIKTLPGVLNDQPYYVLDYIQNK